MHAARELRYLVLALQREGHRRYAESLRPLELTPSQAEVLTVLAGYGTLSLNRLGELLVCESGTSPSRLVDRLVAAGLVDRQTDPDDRRHLRLRLTAEGRARAERVAAAEAEFEQSLTARVTDHPVEPVLAMLRAMAADTPAGRALEQRRLDGMP